MPRWGNRLAKFLAGISVTILFASLLVLFIVFLRDAKSGTQFAAMWKGIAAFVPGAAISAFIFRGLIRRSKQGGTATHIVTAWLAEEPLLHAAVWVFVVVELITLSYFARIYALRVAVVGARVTPLAERLQVVSDPGNFPFNRESWSPERATFRSSRAFKWGEDVRVRTLGAQGYAEDTLHVQWNGFAPLYVGAAIALPDLVLQPDEVELLVSAPEAVTVTYRWAKDAGSIQGVGRVRLPRGMSVHVTATGQNFQTLQLSVSPSRDTTLDFSTMKMVPGRLRISAFSAGRRPQHDMNVFIEGIAAGFAVDQWIELSPNTYRVRLERVWPTEIDYAGPFTIRIGPRQARDCRVEIAVRAVNTPAPPRGGTSPCST